MVQSAASQTSKPACSHYQPHHPPELLCQALWWRCHSPVQAVDCAHVAGMQYEGAVTASTWEQRPPLCTHNPCHLHIICRHTRHAVPWHILEPSCMHGIRTSMAHTHMVLAALVLC